MGARAQLKCYKAHLFHLALQFLLAFRFWPGPICASTCFRVLWTSPTSTYLRNEMASNSERAKK